MCTYVCMCVVGMCCVCIHCICVDEYVHVPMCVQINPMCAHINPFSSQFTKLFSYKPFLKSIHKTNPYKNIKQNLRTQILNTNVRRVSLILPLLKEYIRPGHASFVD